MSNLDARDALVLLLAEAEDASRRLHVVNELACEEGFVGTELSAKIGQQAHNGRLWIAITRARRALAHEEDA